MEYVAEHLFRLDLCSLRWSTTKQSRVNGTRYEVLHAFRSLLRLSTRVGEKPRIQANQVDQARQPKYNQLQHTLQLIRTLFHTSAHSIWVSGQPRVP